MKDYKKIAASLDKLDDDFNKQLSAIGTTKTNFYDSLIELTAKYPEHKELLQFIVHINDKLETNHNIFSEVITDTFAESIKVKKQIIIKLMEDREENDKIELEKKTTFIKKVFILANWFKDTKLIFASLALIIVTAGAITSPDTFLVILKAIAKIIP